MLSSKLLSTFEKCFIPGLEEKIQEKLPLSFNLTYNALVPGSHKGMSSILADQ
jgi:hypothetical protein